VLDQYIGIGLLVAISTLGLFISLVIPAHIIELLGILPIAIGVKKIIEFRKNDESNSSIRGSSIESIGEVLDKFT
jgi:cadmium resistance protein CadD (predicted permease)